MAENQSNKPIDYSLALTDLPISVSQELAGKKLEYRARICPDPGAPLIVLVHGRAGDRSVMWTFARVLPAAVSVITPQALYEDPVQPHSPQGKSWWQIGDGSGLLNKATQAAQLLSGYIIRASEIHKLEPRKIIGIGFSQGAALISAATQLHPGLFNSIALLSGFVIEIGRMNELRGMPVFLAHGTKDEVAPLGLFKRGEDYLRRAGANLEVSIEEVGHKVGSKSMKALAAWLTKQVV